ncbi:tandem-95 repeat protein, partial [Ramlibacter sp.]|uniref:tandem-95 repeat protein n=1 Tax=Ramlibacter sp. TaxID=1917967 RepID=UPI0035B17977
SVTAAGQVIYTPNTNFNGTDSFTYTVTSPAGVTETATVNVTVTSVNDPPVNTVPATRTAGEDTTVTFTGGNTISVSDPDNNVTSATLTIPNGTLTVTPGGATVSGNGSGTVVITGSQTDINTALSTLSLVPTPDYNGTSTLTVVTTDGSASDTDTVAVTITPVGDAVDDNLTTNEDTAVTANVLIGTGGASADNFEGTPTVTATSTPANGSVSFNGTGQVIYTPNSNFNGTDTFTYTVTSPAGITETATVTVTVNAVNDPPVNTVPGAQTVTEDGTVTFNGGNTISVTDVDNNVASATLVIPNGGLTVTPSGTTVTGNGSGTVVITGTQTNINTALSTLVLVPTADYNGTNTLTVVTSDGAASDTDTVVVTTTAVADIVNDNATTAEDTPATINVLANDTFENGGRVISHINGSTITDGGASVTVTNGSVALVSGQLIFTPATNFNGTVPNFTYTVTSGGVTETATVSVTVTAVNDPPTTVADAYTLPESTTSTITALAGVKANDSDPEGDTFSVTQVATTSGGTIIPVNGTNVVTTTLGGTVVMNADGSFTYTAPARDHSDVTPDVDTFAYRAFDGTSLSAWTTVSITITDRSPTAVADTDSVVRATSTTGNVILGTGGPTADISNGDALNQLTAVSFVGTPTSSTFGGGVWTIATTTGTLTIEQDGDYTYQSTAPAPTAVRTVAAGRTAAQWETDLGGTTLQVRALDGTTPWVGGTPSTGLNTGAGTAGVVTTVTGGLGIGVETGGGSGNTDAFRIQPNEYLIINLDAQSRNTDLTFNALGAGEDAQWFAFDSSGNFVAQGQFTNTTAGQIQTNTPFQYIVLSAGTGDAYSLNGLSALPPIDPVVFNYTVNDIDGSTSSTTLTINTSLGIAAAPDVCSVNEAGLTDGSAPLSPSAPTTASGNLLLNDGISVNTVITQVNGTAPVANVITVTDTIGTLQVWTAAVSGKQPGDYVYTLNDNTISSPGTPVSDVRSYSYTIQDTVTLQTANSTLTVNVSDDAPAATNSTAQVVEIGAAGYELVLILDVSGSMDDPTAGGEVRSVADDGTASITTRLAMAKAGMVALVEEYFQQSSYVAVKLGLFASTAVTLNGGVAYTNKQTLINAINAITGNETGNSGTDYVEGLNTGLGLWNGAWPTSPSGVPISRASYFLSDGVPTEQVAATPATTTTYLTALVGSNAKSYGVGLGTGIPDTSYLDAIHRVDSNLDGTPDSAIIVPDLNRLNETLVATVPAAYTGSVGGSGGASNVTFGSDGGYISYIEVTLDGVDGDALPDQLVRFTYDPGANQITNDSGGYYATTAGSLLNIGVLSSGTTSGFTWGTLIFNFATGQYTYFTAPSVNEGDTFSIGFQVTDNDGDTAIANQTIEVIDGGPIARTDYDTVVANQRFFEGNVINGIGTDGGAVAEIVDFSSASVSTDSIIDGARVTSIVFRGQSFDLTTPVAAGTAAVTAGGTYGVQAANAKTVTLANVATAWTDVTIQTWGFDGTNPYVTAGTPNSGLNTAALTPAQAALVRYRDNAGTDNDGTGAETGALTDTSRQIENGEQLILRVDSTGTYTQATVTVTDLAVGEVAQWHAYNAAGVWVGSGTYTSTGATPQSFVMAPTQAFQYAVFTSTAAGNVYSVRGFDAVPMNRLSWTSAAEKVVSTGNSAAGWSTPTTGSAVGTWGFDGTSPFVTAGVATSGINTASLTVGAAGNVRYRDNAGTDSDGTGAETGALNDTSRQIENGELLVLRVDTTNAYGSVDITVTNLTQGEVAQWHAYDATGAWVASGTYTGISATAAQTFTINPGAPIQYVVMTSTAAGNVYSVNGLRASREALSFDTDGYYKFTPIDTETPAQTVAAAVTTLFTSQANGAANGVVLTGFSRTANLQLAATYTAATLTYDNGGTPADELRGVSVPGGDNGNRVDNLETLVVTFDAGSHPRGVQNVIFEMADQDSNLGGAVSVTYSVYDIHGNLLTQISSNLEDNARIPLLYSNIGRVEIESASHADVKVYSVSFQSVTGAGAGAAIAPEQISYTLTDTDTPTPDTSTANLNLNVISNHDTGTTGADGAGTFNSSALNDYLSGGAGNDTINGGAGYDLIRGDAGDDVLDGQDDDDRLFGGDGNDSLSGSNGNDEINGDDGNDTLLGGAGADVLYGGAGTDSINGGAGVDNIWGGTGNDTVDGGGADGVSDVFRWELTDTGTKGLPAVDTIVNFDNANAGSGGDVLDLRDILVGETSSASSLDDYLHFEISGADTKIHISSTGEFSASYSATREVQTIVLQGVDLVGTYTTNQEIIQDLLTRGKILTN